MKTIQGTVAFVSVAVGLLLTSVVLAGDPPRGKPEELGFSAQRLVYIDQFYAEKVKTGEMAGAVILVARHGKIAHFSAIGYSDVEKKELTRTDTIFRLYSMTKPVASIALMMLYEEGRFQMSDPLSKYLPEFATPRVLRVPEATIDDTVPLEHAPTMQDVLRHTAGFSHGLSDSPLDVAYKKADLFGLDVSLAEMMARLAKLPLREQPGTRFTYGVGPDVQGRLVEVLSGLSFDRFLEERLFKPLKMRDSGFWVPPDRAKRLTKVHWSKNGKLTPLDEAHGQPEADSVLTQSWSVNSYTVNHRHKGGSFGMVSTAEDYFRMAQMMLNGGELEGARVLSPQIVKYMVQDHLGPIPMTQPNGKPTGIGWGLGFAIMHDAAAAGYMSSEGTFFWHGVAGTTFWVDPREDLVVVAMVQHMGVPAMSNFYQEIRSLVYSALLQ